MEVHAFKLHFRLLVCKDGVTSILCEWEGSKKESNRPRSDSYASTAYDPPLIKPEIVGRLHVKRAARSTLLHMQDKAHLETESTNQSSQTSNSGTVVLTHHVASDSTNRSYYPQQSSMFMINMAIRILVEYYWIQGLNPISSLTASPKD